MATLHPKLKALGIAPGKYDRQTDAVRLARRLRKELGKLERHLQRLDVDSARDAAELQERHALLQMAAVELLGLGFGGRPQGRNRLPAAFAMSLVRLVEVTARRCSDAEPPDPRSKPTFPDDYPDELVEAVELHLALLEEAAPDLARSVLRRRDDVLKKLCEATASKILSRNKRGVYLSFVAGAIVVAGVMKTCSESNLRTFMSRIG